MDAYTKDALTSAYNEAYTQAVRNAGAIDESILIWAHLVAGTIARRQDLVDAMYTEAQRVYGVDAADLATIRAEDTVDELYIAEAEQRAMEKGEDGPSWDDLADPDQTNADLSLAQELGVDDAADRFAAAYEAYEDSMNPGNWA